METKLTLTLKEDVFERASIYARSHNISLSQMIEAYLNRLTNQKEEEKKATITPLVESLSGVIDLPADYDFKKDYHDFLEEKYR